MTMTINDNNSNNNNNNNNNNNDKFLMVNLSIWAEKGTESLAQAIQVGA